MESDLRRANVMCAHSNCRGANIGNADSLRSNLTGADLRGADLSTAIGLTEAQICHAPGDDLTRLSAGLAKPSNWTLGKGA
jgi:uncharacterized protein YjbI with pentapeptide repeats